MRIWVDDIRPAPEGWAWARSYEEAVDMLDRYGADITEISLDHDLCPAHSNGDYSDGRTGYDVLEALLNLGLRPRIWLHTMSAAGMQRMLDLVDSMD
jgi:hypothetical protein